MNNKLAFYCRPFPRVKTFYEMVDEAANFGLPGVEILSYLDFASPDIERAKILREHADEKGIIIPCVSVGASFAPSSYEQSIEKLKKFADITKILGSPYLHHTIIPDCRDYLGIMQNFVTLYKNGIKGVREIYDYAESIGIKTIFEDQGFMFNGVENFGNFLADVNRDVGVVADATNVDQTKSSILQFVNAFADKVCHVHLKDSIFKDEYTGPQDFFSLSGKYVEEVEIGKGNTPLKEMLQTLKNAGYDGYYGIEYGFKEDDNQKMTNMLNYINTLFEE